MNFLIKRKYSRLWRNFRFYSTTSLEHKQKSDIEIEQPKILKPFSKEMLLSRFNINLLEFPEIPTTESLEQALKVSKEIDNLLNARDSFDRNSMLSRLSSSGIMGVSVRGVFIENNYNWMMVARLIESLASDVDYTLTRYLSQTLVCQCFVRAGNEDQKKQYLLKLAKAELTGCIAITEGLSDMIDEASITTSATIDPTSDSWIINGQKTQVFNYDQSNIVIVIARTPDGDIAPFIVDSKSEGIKKKSDTSGKKLYDSLQFVNVKVPKENILSSELGVQLPRYLATINNIGISAMCSSLIKSLIVVVNEFVCSRHIFGKKLSQYETIQEHIVRLTGDSYLTETAAYFAAGIIDGHPVSDFYIESTMGKICSLESLRRCVDLTMRIVGTNCLSDPRFKKLYDDVDVLLRNQVPSKLSRFDCTRECLRYACDQLRVNKEGIVDQLMYSFEGYYIKGAYEENIVVKSFKYNLHPRLSEFTEYIYPLYYKLTKILKKWHLSPELLDNHVCLGALSSVLVDTYVMMAAMGRASRSIATGLRNHDHEVLVTEIICRDVCARTDGYVASLEKYMDEGGKKLEEQVTIRAIDDTMSNFRRHRTTEERPTM